MLEALQKRKQALFDQGVELHARIRRFVLGRRTLLGVTIVLGVLAMYSALSSIWRGDLWSENLWIIIVRCAGGRTDGLSREVRNESKRSLCIQNLKESVNFVFV